MSETPPPPPGAPPPASDGTPARAERSRAWLVAGSLVAGMVIGGLGVGGFAVAKMRYPFGWLGRGPSLEKVERMAAGMLLDVDATPEQRARINDIVEATYRDLEPLRRKRGDFRHQAMTLLQAATVDRGEAERLRAEQQRENEAASRRVTAALVEIAEVLTPQQRAELADTLTHW